MNREKREIKPLLNQPSGIERKTELLVADDKISNGEELPQSIKDIPIPKSLKERTKGKIFIAKMTFGKEDIMTESELKAEIKRVNEILRNKPDYHTYKQNKKYLERLERKLRNYGKK